MGSIVYWPIFCVPDISQSIASMRKSITCPSGQCSPVLGEIKFYSIAFGLSLFHLFLNRIIHEEIYIIFKINDLFYDRKLPVRTYSCDPIDSIHIRQ